MKKLKDVGYVQTGMVLMQGGKEFEVTKVMCMGNMGTYAFLDGDEKRGLPISGASFRDDIFIKSMPLT